MKSAPMAGKSWKLSHEPPRQAWGPPSNACSEKEGLVAKETQNPKKKRPIRRHPMSSKIKHPSSETGNSKHAETPCHTWAEEATVKHVETPRYAWTEQATVNMLKCHATPELNSWADNSKHLELPHYAWIEQATIKHTDMPCYLQQ